MYIGTSSSSEEETHEKQGHREEKTEEEKAQTGAKRTSDSLSGEGRAKRTSDMLRGEARTRVIAPTPLDKLSEVYAPYMQVAEHESLRWYVERALANKN